jgi:glycine cleavage system H protein
MAQVEEFYLPDELFYDRKEHIWAKVEGGLVRLGLDKFGQKAAGTVAYVKLLPPGRRVNKGRAFGSIEAGKYVGPLKAPLSGVIRETNSEVLSNPRLVNTDPYGAGWFVVMEPLNLGEELADLVHGEEVQAWLESQVKEYREKGLLGEEEKK